MAGKRCHYKVLNVSRSASQQQIAEAYRKLSKKYHPDFNPGDEIAAARMKEITEAFEVLGDKQQRARYDRETEERPSTELTVPDSHEHQSEANLQQHPAKQKIRPRLRDYLLGLPGIIALILIIAIGLCWFVVTYKTPEDHVRDRLAKAEIKLKSGNISEAEGLLGEASEIEGADNQYEINNFRELLQQKKEDRHQEILAEEQKAKAEEQEEKRQRDAADRNRQQKEEAKLLARASTYQKTDGTTVQVFRLDDEGDFRKINLRPGMQTPPSDLSFLDLSHADLVGANITNAKIANTNLSHADLSGADLRKSNLTKTNLSDADLSGTNLMDAIIPKTNFTRANLSGVRFTYNNWKKGDSHTKGWETANFADAWYYADSPPVTSKKKLLARLIAKQRSGTNVPPRKAEANNSGLARPPGPLSTPQDLDAVEKYLAGKTKEQVKEYMMRPPDYLPSYAEVWLYKGNFKDSVSEKTFRVLRIEFVPRSGPAVADRVNFEAVKQ